MLRTGKNLIKKNSLVKIKTYPYQFLINPTDNGKIFILRR